MGPQEPEADHESQVASPHARRALGLIAVSVLAIAFTGLAYVHPFTFGARQVAGARAQAAYKLAGVDFVSPANGWFAATLDSGRYAVLHTSDAGASWTRQLSGELSGRGVYMQFFDSGHGVFALTGAQSLIFRTADGGRTWSSRPVMNSATSVLSMSFIDPNQGWLLTRSELFRTRDGGGSWTNLGTPVSAADQAYQVHFSDNAVGWLDSVSERPYAYKSVDGGRSWRQLPLLPPGGGLPSAGQFFVAAQPTQGAGVVATIVGIAPFLNRLRIGQRVVAYPPLTIRAFDGGEPVTYSQEIFADAMPGVDLAAAGAKVNSGFWAQVQAPHQVEVSSLDGGVSWSVIAPPTAPGAIGYSDAQTWWWIGYGAWSTSSDAGTTWTPSRTAGVQQPLPGSLQVLDSRHAWFGAMVGTTAVLQTTEDGGLSWEMIGLPAIRP
jgi:photosystem II stability/assembly factor-like uncharacterized protein